MQLTCIMCPLGCRVTVEKVGDSYTVTGNTCKRGETYAIQETQDPKRVVTAIFTLDSGDVISCKTDQPVSKNKVFGILKQIQQATKSAPVSIGDVLIENAFDSGANIVATSEHK